MKITSNFLREAKRLLGRIRYTRVKLPVITHILASLDAHGITLAVTDLDLWLETRTDATPEPCEPTAILIPMDAMAAATRADKGTMVTFTARGARNRREIRVTAQCGGIMVESTHPTMDVAEFPQRPVIEGASTIVPLHTMESLSVVAGCASTDSTRYVLNSVLFTPDQDGCLIATDGRRLACAPAVVPSDKFILPNAAAHVLIHPDFTGREAEIIVAQEAENRHVAFRSGNHLLVSKTIDGAYPDYRQAIPRNTPELVTIAGDRRPGVIGWLRGLPDTRSSVRLSWEKRGQITLTQRTASNAAAVLRVPVEIQGRPPVIAFNPRLLADALEIGSTLCLLDEMTPGICRNPNGRYCLLMPCRCEVTAEEQARSQQQQAANQAA